VRIGHVPGVAQSRRRIQQRTCGNSCTTAAADEIGFGCRAPAPPCVLIPEQCDRMQRVAMSCTDFKAARHPCAPHYPSVELGVLAAAQVLPKEAEPSKQGSVVGKPV
jgi:hypothetical protein